MKKLFLALAVSLSAVAAQSVQAQDKIGNGGDEVALQFAQAFNTAIATIEAKLPELAFKVREARLRDVLAKATILVTEETLKISFAGVEQESIAMNQPQTRTIVINRLRWSEAPDVHILEALALHEVASLAGLEDTGRYPLSSAYLALFGMNESPRDNFSPSCSATEQHILRRTRGRFNLGDVTMTDVALADLNLQKALFNKCGSLSKIYFCATAKSLYELAVTGMAEEARVSMRTEKEVDDLRIERANHRQLCR